MVLNHYTLMVSRKSQVCVLSMRLIFFLLLEKDEEIHQLKENLKDMERRLQESQDKLNQRDQALALEGNSE